MSIPIFSSVRKKIEKNFWDIEIIGNRRKKALPKSSLMHCWSEINWSTIERMKNNLWPRALTFDIEPYTMGWCSTLMTEKEENGGKGFAKIIPNALLVGNQLTQRCPTLVDKIRNFTKAEPLFDTWLKMVRPKKVANDQKINLASWKFFVFFLSKRA